MEKKLPIADVMMLHLMTGGAVDDHSNEQRTYMFCMDIENVAREIEGLPEDQFIEKFLEEIKKSSGYRSFESFCQVDEDGLRDLGQKAYELLK